MCGAARPGGGKGGNVGTDMASMAGMMAAMMGAMSGGGMGGGGMGGGGMGGGGMGGGGMGGKAESACGKPGCKWCALGQCWGGGGKGGGGGGGYGAMKGGKATGQTRAAPYAQQSSFSDMMAKGPMNMPQGDWNCPSCGDLQFERNSTCRMCGTPKPGSAGQKAAGGGMANAFGGAMTGGSGKGFLPGLHSPGDWLCPSCGDHQFSRNSSCRKCGAAKPQEAGSAAGDMNGMAQMMAMMMGMM